MRPKAYVIISGHEKKEESRAPLTRVYTYTLLSSSLSSFLLQQRRIGPPLNGHTR